MRSYLLSVLTAMAAIACGGDDATGPTGSLSVAGNWSVSISNLTGEGAFCSTSSPIQVNFRQTGSTFTGSHTGGILTCVTPTESFSAAVGSGSITNGQMSGNNVSFELGPVFHHSGTLNGTSMSGTAQWTYDFGFPMEEVALTGSWTATKQ